MAAQVRPLLEQLEAGLAEADPAAALAPLAYLAGREVGLDPAELQAARRRALLILAAGGDPHRPLDPGGRAVRALADDLDSPARRDELAAALAGLRREAAGLARVLDALDALLAAPDEAWRCLALALLADELADAG